MSVTLSKYDLDFKSSMFDTLASLNLASRISALLFFFSHDGIRIWVVLRCTELFVSILLLIHLNATFLLAIIPLERQHDLDM